MKTELQDYYRELILDHSRRPRNRGVLQGATHRGVSSHPEKGDVFAVSLSVQDGRIESVRFEGEGSAIALASASLLTVRVKGLTSEEAQSLASAVLDMLNGPMDAEVNAEYFGDLSALEGVRRFPARILCARLAWEALVAALDSPIEA